MAKSMRKTLVLAKIQASAGLDPTPTAALNAILCRASNITPISAEFAERNLVRPYFGNLGQVAVTQYSQIEIEVELAGSGTAGTAPAFGALLRACGLAETTSAGSNVKYQTASAALELVTIYAYLDGVLHKMVDCRASMSLDITSRAVPFVRFTVMGAYAPITDTATPAGAVFTAFKTPLGVNKTNTPTWLLHGYTGCLNAFTLDLANQLVWRSMVGCEGAAITDRKPTGSAVLELPTIAGLDWPAKVVAGTLGAFSITHGVGAGNIVQVDMPKVQLTNPTYSDQDGVAMLNLTLGIQPDAGNDEIVLTFK